MRMDLTAMDPIIIKGDLKGLRPTLFDLIAQDALDFYKTGEGINGRSVQPIHIQQEAVLGNFRDFANASLIIPDSNAAVFKAALLFQQLIRFHLADTSKEALIDIDIDRLNWAKQSSQINFKNEKWTASMKLLTAPANYCKMAAFAWQALAEQSMEDAKQYKVYVDSAGRWKYVEAQQLIDQAIKLYDSSNPAYGALINLKQSLLQKSISTMTEK